MVFQPIRCTAPRVTTGTGELLPHLFTIVPTCRNMSGLLFSVTLLYPFGYLPVRKDGALRCPDFPPRHLSAGATDRPAGGKDSQLFRIRRSAIASSGLHISSGGSPCQSVNEFHALAVISPIRSSSISSKTATCFCHHGSKLIYAISVTF